MTTKIRLYLSPDCPRFARTPVQDDGRFDAKKFGKLLGLQEKGAPLDDYVKVMRNTVMEDTPLVRQRETLIEGSDVQEFECHPETWASLPDDVKAQFEVINPPPAAPASSPSDRPT